MCCVHWTSFRQMAFIEKFLALKCVMQCLKYRCRAYVMFKLFQFSFSCYFARLNSPLFVQFNCTILCECCGFSGFHSCGLLISSKQARKLIFLALSWFIGMLLQHCIGMSCCTILKLGATKVNGIWYGMV